MTISTMAMALNVGIGFTVWMSDLPLVAQIILTVILVAKTVLFTCILRRRTAAGAVTNGRRAV